LSTTSSLAGLRVGAVSYLNTKPLIWPFAAGEYLLDVPARLADAFYQGRLDVAILPIFEVLRHGGGPVVDDVAIACEGEVYSVVVGSPTAFEDSGEIYLDPSSRSSVALLRVLIAEYYPHLRVGGGVPPEGAARLLIGDPAIAFHRNLPPGWQCHDLGAIWRKHTGLPFVFAGWALQPGLPNKEGVARTMWEAKEAGRKAVRQIADAEPDPAFAFEYLTRYVRFDLREPEREAIRLFARLAAKHGLLDGEPVVEFVSSQG
jgi:chorismate dehydratase